MRPTERMYMLLLSTIPGALSTAVILWFVRNAILGILGEIYNDPTKIEYQFQIAVIVACVLVFLLGSAYATRWFYGVWCDCLKYMRLEYRAQRKALNTIVSAFVGFLLDHRYPFNANPQTDTTSAICLWETKDFLENPDITFFEAQEKLGTEAANAIIDIRPIASKTQQRSNLFELYKRVHLATATIRNLEASLKEACERVLAAEADIRLVVDLWAIFSTPESERTPERLISRVKSLFRVWSHVAQKLPKTTASGFPQRKSTSEDLITGLDALLAAPRPSTAIGYETIRTLKKELEAKDALIITQETKIRDLKMQVEDLKSDAACAECSLSSDDMPTFDGNCEKFAEWKCRLENLFYTAAGLTPAKMVGLTLVSMTGTAAAYTRNVAAASFIAETTAETQNRMFSELEMVFGDPHAARKARENLHSFSSTGMTWCEFILDFEATVRKAGFNTTEGSECVRFYFLGAISEDIKDCMRVASTTDILSLTYDELKSLARRVWIIEESKPAPAARRGKAAQSFTGRPPCPDTNAPAEWLGDLATEKGLRQRLNVENRCWKCRHPGDPHYFPPGKRRDVDGRLYR